MNLIWWIVIPALEEKLHFPVVCLNDGLRRSIGIQEMSSLLKQRVRQPIKKPERGADNCDSRNCNGDLSDNIAWTLLRFVKTPINTSPYNTNSDELNTSEEDLDAREKIHTPVRGSPH